MPQTGMRLPESNSTTAHRSEKRALFIFGQVGLSAAVRPQIRAVNSDRAVLDMLD
jgi:hypothetical protein